jgi:molecular chaperone DnaK (HSP70)
MPMELSEKQRRDRAEYRRLVDEEFERKRKTGFKNAEEALKAFRDLFESDEEMDEFMAAIRRDRSIRSIATDSCGARRPRD